MSSRLRRNLLYRSGSSAASLSSVFSSLNGIETRRDWKALSSSLTVQLAV